MASETSDQGWKPLEHRPRRVGREAFVVSPFTRLARTHAAAVAGDTLIALALAGSLFFSMEPDAARGRIALYLVLTMAPFAVVAPLIGPALDRARGGRRLILIGANALRAVMCLFMIRHLESLLLFPEAFTVMVLSKSYSVAKSAVVPTTVRSDTELVEANSRLSFLSGVMGFVAAIPGGLAVLIADSEGVLVLAMIMFAVAAGFAARIPATRVAKDPTSVEEREELRSGGIIIAASAMGLLRGMVGFLTFLIAFELRGDDADPWQFGVALAASGLGALAGSLIAPLLRRSGMPEERMVQAMLAVTAAGGVLCAYAGGLVAMAAMAASLGTAASGSKLAFDAIVQRDAPDANRGRSFAKFETRFQLIWVVGAFVPVVVPIPARIGFLIISGGAAFALFSYLAGIRALRSGRAPVRRRNPLTGLARPITARMSRPGRASSRASESSPSSPPSPSRGRSREVDDLPPPPPPPPPPPVRRQDNSVVVDPTRLQ